MTWEPVVEVDGDQIVADLIRRRTMSGHTLAPAPAATRVGDPVIALGDRDDRLSVDRLARTLGPIPDHVLAALSPTLRRDVFGQHVDFKRRALN